MVSHAIRANQRTGVYWWARCACPLWPHLQDTDPCIGSRSSLIKALERAREACIRYPEHAVAIMAVWDHTWGVAWEVNQ